MPRLQEGRRPARGVGLLAVTLATVLGATALRAQQAPSVIFFHPDGMGVNTWGAVRIGTVGPDRRLHWDRLPFVAVYTGHMRDALASTSHGGATVHAYGVKVLADSYGMDGDRPLTARSGKAMSLLREAQAAGRAVGVVNSGTITEPGTGVFLASVPRRSDHAEIARQIIEAQPEVILGGGERYFLPLGVAGRHGEGTRGDGLDLVARARELGYAVVYTRDELLALPPDTRRVLGLFAANHTFNDRPEETLRTLGLPPYAPGAPSVSEMSRVALAILARHPRGFMLVVEEEGTDNFANSNNASGLLEAGRRADEAVGTMIAFVQAHPRTLMIMTSDSDAGGLQLLGSTSIGGIRADTPLPARDPNGAPLDGVEGTGTVPFVAPPDTAGRRWPFAIAWASGGDASGGILVRAIGRGADRVRGTMDNTDIYRVMYLALFGRDPDPNRRRGAR
ncbi:MAG: alkaline phosphatase [Gemmatimonadota bacterium]|nr:alkaline phosphatase [Gemmatimonadota bacterium]